MTDVMGHLTRPNTAVTSETFCESIPLEAVGFHPNVGGDGSADFDLSYLLNFCKDRALQEVAERSEECLFCRKVADCFHGWSRRVFVGGQGPDLSKSRARFQFYRHGCDPEGYFMRFVVHFVAPKPCNEKENFYSLMLFQRCIYNPPEVEEFCNGVDDLFVWEREGDMWPYCGRIRPLVLDTHLVKKWKQTCCAVHGCGVTFAGERPRLLRLIDVENRCVVDSILDEENRYVVGSEVGVSYVALSYVWGETTLKDRKMPKLTGATENGFRQGGSLTRETVLSTIEDAMEATSGL